ncbi:hypothetical protein ACFGU2_004529, partial [Providencia rettgeri]
KVVLPDGTEMQLRTEKERDRLLDGKFDKSGGTVNGSVNATLDVQGAQVRAKSTADSMVNINPADTGPRLEHKTKGGTWYQHLLPNSSGTLMQVGDYGFGIDVGGGVGGVKSVSDYRINSIGYAYSATQSGTYKNGNHHLLNIFGYTNRNYGVQLAFLNDGRIGFQNIENNIVKGWHDFYTTANTTKDSNGNLKAASPVVKLFTDDIELNDESEGVEMERLGIGHYLIKGVVGFNADGAWGINNGFVIPQDHNGKNMVLIDYEVRPDGDIEVFVFHQQNADMPERFQNKRIKHFDEEGAPVYFENYEPCDVPESRWIDMR